MVTTIPAAKLVIDPSTAICDAAHGLYLACRASSPRRRLGMGARVHAVVDRDADDDDRTDADNREGEPWDSLCGARPPVKVGLGKRSNSPPSVRGAFGRLSVGMAVWWQVPRGMVIIDLDRTSQPERRTAPARSSRTGRSSLPSLRCFAVSSRHRSIRSRKRWQ
jgi:hypothetical protein